MPHCWAAKSSSTLCSFSLRLRYTEKAGSSMQLGKPWLPERKKVYDSCSGKVPFSSRRRKLLMVTRISCFPWASACIRFIGMRKPNDSGVYPAQDQKFHHLFIDLQILDDRHHHVPWSSWVHLLSLWPWVPFPFLLKEFIQFQLCRPLEVAIRVFACVGAEVVQVQPDSLGFRHHHMVLFWGHSDSLVIVVPEHCDDLWHDSIVIQVSRGLGDIIVDKSVFWHTLAAALKILSPMLEVW